MSKIENRGVILGTALKSQFLAMPSINIMLYLVPMSSLTQNKITSLEALIHTLNRDQDVLRWFTYLVCHPAVRSKLLNCEEVSSDINNLKKIITVQTVLSVILWFSVIFLVLSKQYPGLIAPSLILLPLSYLQLKKKNMIIKTSVHLLKTEFPKSALCQKTLYQIGEDFSKKYQIPSLVDVLSATNGILSKSLIFSFLSACFIFPGHFWQMMLILILTYYLIQALINTSFIYKRL